MNQIEYESVAFAWDENKDKSNQAKHGISFAIAHKAFFDNNRLTEYGDTVDGEERCRTLGMIDNFVILFIGHTLYDDELGREVTRIITARKATKQEKEEYYGDY